MPTIRMGTISGLLRGVIDPEGNRSIAWNDPLEDYVRGGGGTKTAFANHLNKSVQFAGYKLRLSGQDLADVETVGQLVMAIATRFEANQWIVTT